MSQELSNYRELEQILDEAADIRQVHAVVAPIAERHDKESIFESDQVFDVFEKDSMRACLTFPAAPHISSSIPADGFLAAAKSTLGRDISLGHELENLDNLPAELIVWWDHTHGLLESGGEPLRVAELPSVERALLHQVVAHQATVATRILGRCSGKPVLWGSWGFASTEEHAAQGKNRGVPTNGHGHLHVVNFAADHSVEIEATTTPDERINHLKPWVHLFYSKFGDQVAEVIRTTVSHHLEHNGQSGIPLVTPRNKNGVEYEVTLFQPVKLAVILEIVEQTAATLEKLYHTVSELHTTHLKDGVDTSAAIEAAALEFGFSQEYASQLPDFTHSIKPTYAQLIAWICDLQDRPLGKQGNLEYLVHLKQRYERTQGRVARLAALGSLTYTLIRNTVTNPGTTGRGLWPVRSTGTYVIKDLKEQDDELYVQSVTLLPSIGSTESGPEYILGRSLRRPT